ncbi:hypothetical protein K449DRAFT_422194 [Hypoxylon sp. EC38]|nr:hypothetical protein K449DRAFT_422194 [Hypoxylon sp. EC38]
MSPYDGTPISARARFAGFDFIGGYAAYVLSITDGGRARRCRTSLGGFPLLRVQLASLVISHFKDEGNVMDLSMSFEITAKLVYGIHAAPSYFRVLGYPPRSKCDKPPNLDRITTTQVGSFWHTGNF